FLLKEESGLSETLHRMKANLDACRRTRTEVQEARRLEGEIGGVFEAGHLMFEAAFLAARERADELERRGAAARAPRPRAGPTAASEALAQIIAELGARERRRTEADQLVAAARAWHRRLEDALAIAGEVTRRRRELEEADAALLAAAGRRAVAAAARDRRRA